jgi:hypothetical protein
MYSCTRVLLVLLTCSNIKLLTNVKRRRNMYSCTRVLLMLLTCGLVLLSYPHESSFFNRDRCDSGVEILHSVPWHPVQEHR